MARVGIINNVEAGRNRKRLAQVRAMVRRRATEVLEVGDLASIGEATREMVAREVEVLAVNGGDGTAHAVITQLLNLRDVIPELAIVPGGTTNMTANDLNGRIPLERALQAVFEQAACEPDARRRVSRPLLEVTAGAESAQYGFFFGAGAVLQGMRHFRQHVASRGLIDERAACMSVLRGLAGLARGEPDWGAGHAVAVHALGDEDAPVDSAVVLATTLERLLLGLRPWWGVGPGPIHLTSVGKRPRALLRLAPALLRGRRHPLLSPENGYRSAEVRGFELCRGEAFALDGEVFVRPADGVVSVRATDPMPFLKLAAQ